MSPQQEPQHEVVYAGSQCHCVRVPPAPRRTTERFFLVSHVGKEVMGELQWHPQWDRFAFVPHPGTAWASSTLSEVGLWLRKLTRRALDARMHTTGLLVLLLELLRGS
jgi:hypothetical protein